MDFDHFLGVELDGLARYSAVLTGNRQLAHDILADSLVKAGSRWSKIRSTSNPAAYVRKIVTTTFLQHIRTETRRRTIVMSEPPSTGIGLGLTSEAIDQRDQITQLLRTLPATQQSAIIMRFYLDLNSNEIAQALGCSPATARAHISKGLSSLRLTASAQGD